MAETIRVILADDHAVVRKGTREFLEEAGDIVVVGEASNGAQALQLVEANQPDVAILDVELPDLSGIEVTRAIKSRQAGVRVLILTVYDDDPHIFALLGAGADSYLLKNTGIDELIQAVRETAAGGRALDPSIRNRVSVQLATGKPDTAREQVEPLSERELEILRLAAQGVTNKSIGIRLGISHRTVQGHLASIYAKLQVTSRTEALTKAVAMGWIVLDEYR